jgi:Domain of unknown function (DUF2703)
MQTIIVELFHFQQAGTSGSCGTDSPASTCERCNDSRQSLKTTIEKIAPILRERGIVVDLRHHPVDKSGIDRSNTITINGRDIVELLKERGDIFTFCRSCSDLTGEPTECRVFIYKNRAYEAIPEEMIVEAILKAAGLRA